MKKYFFYIFIFIFLFFDGTHLNLGSFSIQYYQLFAPLLLINIIFYRKIGIIKGYEFCYLALYVYLMVTIIYAIDMLLALRLVILEILLIITYIYLRTEFSKFTISELEKYIILIGKIYIVGSIIFYLMGILSAQFIYAEPGSTYYGVMNESAFPRLVGFTESPNTYILIGLFLLVFFIYAQEKLFILLSIINITLTFSSTGIFLMGLIFLVYIIYHKYYLKFVKAGLFFLGLFSFIYYKFIYENDEIMKMIEIRLERNETGSNRLLIWRDAFDLISENPFFGYGINQTRILLKDFDGINSLHNTYMEVLLTSGMIGLIIYLATLIVLFIQTVKISLYMKESRLILLFIILVTCSFSNNTLHINYLIIYFSIFYQYHTKMHQNQNITSKYERLSVNYNSVI